MYSLSRALAQPQAHESGGTPSLGWPVPICFLTPEVLLSEEVCDANPSLGCRAFQQVQASHERSGLRTHQSACWGQKQRAMCAEMQLKSKPRVTSVGMAPGDQSGLNNLMEGPQLQ